MLTSVAENLHMSSFFLAEGVVLAARLKASFTPTIPLLATSSALGNRNIRQTSSSECRFSPRWDLYRVHKNRGQKQRTKIEDKNRGPVIIPQKMISTTPPRLFRTAFGNSLNKDKPLVQLWLSVENFHGNCAIPSAQTCGVSNFESGLGLVLRLCKKLSTVLSCCLRGSFANSSNNDKSPKLGRVTQK